MLETKRRIAAPMLRHLKFMIEFSLILDISDLWEINASVSDLLQHLAENSPHLEFLPAFTKSEP